MVGQHFISFAQIMLVVVVLTLAFLSGGNCIKGWYWREFLNGEIPPDALVAGEDIAGQKRYIGQAYIVTGGLIVTELQAGQKKIWVAIGGSIPTYEHVKILCGDKRNFSWLKSNRTTLHLDLTGKRAVVGGQEDTYGIMNIGRVFADGETKVGKVNTFWLENAAMFYIDNELEKIAGTYEVLIYEEQSVDPIQLTAQDVFKDVLG